MAAFIFHMCMQSTKWLLKAAPTVMSINKPNNNGCLSGIFTKLLSHYGPYFFFTGILSYTFNASVALKSIKNEKSFLWKRTSISDNCGKLGHMATCHQPCFSPKIFHHNVKDHVIVYKLVTYVSSLPNRHCFKYHFDSYFLEHGIFPGTVSIFLI